MQTETKRNQKHDNKNMTIPMNEQEPISLTLSEYTKTIDCVDTI